MPGDFGGGWEGVPHSPPPRSEEGKRAFRHVTFSHHSLAFGYVFVAGYHYYIDNSCPINNRYVLKGAG